MQIFDNIKGRRGICFSKKYYRIYIYLYSNLILKKSRHYSLKHDFPAAPGNALLLESPLEVYFGILLSD